jgi:hypothetical protein
MIQHSRSSFLLKPLITLLTVASLPYVPKYILRLLLTSRSIRMALLDLNLAELGVTL